MLGVWGHMLHEKIFENMVQFGAFWYIFLLDCILKINISLYKRIIIIATRLL